MKCTKLDIGDLVLVSQTAFQGKHKISDQWENDPYIIVGKHQGIPVYKIEPVMGRGKSNMRVLHRNMLLPLAMDTQVRQKATADSGYLQGQ